MLMKRKLLLFALLPALTAMLTCTSCGDDGTDGSGKAVFTLGSPDDGNDPSAVRISSGNYSKIFTIETPGAWRIEKSETAGWLSVRPESGEGAASVYFSAASNDNPEPRSADIIFYAGAQPVHTLVFEQAANTPYLTITPETGSVPVGGGDITLLVDTNLGEWDYAVASGDGEWLAEKAKTSTSLTLTAAANERFSQLKATVTFSVTGYPDLKQEVEVTQNGFTADLLDLVFNNDGTATDISPMHNVVECLPGASLMTYYNDSYGRYVARFNHEPGANPSSGYYKVDYFNNQTFRDALADGHTLEVLVMFDAEADGEKEIKPLSSMQGGGTGFLITKKDRGTELTFLPHLTSGGWQWTRSGVTPQRAKYYHLVGVWDKTAQKSRIYVNGEQKAEIAAKGNFNFPNNDNCYWFGIGCDAGDNKAEAGWRGDIAIVRIYGDPLSADKVATLWNEVKDLEPQGSVIELSDITFLPNALVKAGSVYKVLGKGFQAGDRMRLESVDDEKSSFLCDATVTDASIGFEIPGGFVSGNYRMVLMRGDARCPIGFVELTLSDNPTLQNLPQVIAHRGFHTTNGAAENSLASLEAAIALGVYGSEADFYITRDGVVVSNHDPDINGVKIESADYDDIKDIELSNGEKVATLDVYLDEIAEAVTKLIIEIKPHSTTEHNNRVVDAIVGELAARGMNDRVDFISFNYAICQRLAAKVPGALVGYLQGDKSPWSMSPDIKCIDYPMAALRQNPRWVRDAHARGMKVNVWTVNSQADMMEFIGMGVDFITTDHPDTLREMLSELAE